MLLMERHEKRHGKTISYAKKVHDIEQNKENFDGYLNYSLNETISREIS
jgi:hypothetical protein